MWVTLVLGFSLALQVGSALLALFVYFRYSRHWAWLLLAAAITLMAVRRSVPFTRLLIQDVSPPPDLLGESIALVISVLMFTGLGLVGPIFRRMNEAEASRDALLQEQYEAQHVRSLNVLAGGVAHDFNNILTAIMGHAELAREGLASDSVEASSLDEIQTASRRAAELCTELLAYAGHELGENEVIRPDEAVRELVDFLRASVGRDVEIQVETDSPPPPIVGSRSRLTRVLMNLVLNAAEAVAPDGGRIQVTVDGVRIDHQRRSRHVGCGPLRPGEYARLTVSDNGSGMSDEVLDRVFEPFFTTKFTGRGLGLSAALGIVRSQHGAIEIESSPGRGTDVHVYWPAASAAAIQRAAGKPRGESRVPVLRGLRVLLVDDETSLREVTGLFLRRLGCAVLAADSGEQALDLVADQARSVDAALIDYSMPGMGGMETMKQVRDLRPGLPVIVMSGFPEDRLQALLARHPDVVFLPKPFDGRELESAFAQALAHSHDHHRHG